MKPLVRLALGLGVGAGLLTAALAAPFGFRVVADGAPAGFAGAVEKAFTDWAGLKNTTLRVKAANDASLTFAWGDDGVEFNPDALTRTVVRETGAKSEAPKVSTEVRVSPAAAGALESTLLAEAGQRLGLAVSPAVSGSGALGAADAALLQDKYPIVGDLNADKRVDVDDLALLAANYGKKAGDGGGSVQGDLNDDGVVDDRDLEAIKANYTFDAPALTPAAPAVAPATTPGATPAPAAPGATPPGTSPPTATPPGAAPAPVPANPDPVTPVPTPAVPPKP